MSIGDKNLAENKSIFETIAEVSKNKNAKEEAERLEKIDETVNYDKLSIVDKNDKKVIGFAKYINLDLFPKRIFYGSISLKRAEKIQDEMESEIYETYLLIMCKSFLREEMQSLRHFGSIFFNFVIQNLIQNLIQ